MKQLVLVGAGHPHLLPLRQTREFVRHGIAVTLIAPGEFWYSGEGPGMISGFYQPADDTVDVRALVERGGGKFLEDTVERIDPAGRELRLTSGSRLRYDALSFNVGSEVPLEKIPGAAEFALKRFRPQKKFLLAFWFKDWLDRRLLRQFQRTASSR